MLMLHQRMYKNLGWLGGSAYNQWTVSFERHNFFADKSYCNCCKAYQNNMCLLLHARTSTVSWINANTLFS